jgi:hypothetical protein
MALPDKHKDEPTTEVSADAYTKWVEAKNNAVQWGKVAAAYRTLLEQQMGDAFAATVDGIKVLTHRPADTYATARIQKDHPQLTQHFLRHEMVETFDVQKFAAAYPEIAEKYRVRSFREVEQS